jgi:hypothetical protein
MIRAALMAALLCGALPARAADDFTQEPQGWFGFFGQKKLENSVFVLWLDVHARLHGSGKQTNLILRPGVGVRFRPDMVGSRALPHRCVPSARPPPASCAGCRSW